MGNFRDRVYETEMRNLTLVNTRFKIVKNWISDSVKMYKALHANTSKYEPHTYPFSRFDKLKCRMIWRRAIKHFIALAKYPLDIEIYLMLRRDGMLEDSDFMRIIEGGVNVPIIKEWNVRQ